MRKYSFLKKSSVLLMATVLLTGCFGETEDADKNLSKTNDSKKNELFAKGESDFTVLQLKEKYGEVENDKDKILPFYNVPKDQVFEFKFTNKDLYSLPSADLVSVHSDSKGLEESKLLASTFVHHDIKGDGSYTLEVAPLSYTLGNELTKNSNEKSWGNAPIYYLNIKYDFETGEKLDKPTIVPFTIQSDVEVPNTSYTITSEGDFILTWDKVDGVDSYNIYNMSKYDLLTTNNLPVSGAETGYKNNLMKVGSVDGNTTEFYDEKNVNILYEGTSNETVLYQNAFVKGDYFVTAVKDGKESNFTQAVSTTKLIGQIPKEVISEPIVVKKESDLPKQLEIEFIDGSTQLRNITYTGVDSYNNPTYVVNNTRLKGSINIDFALDIDKVSKENSKDPVGGNVEVQNETKQVPEQELPTIIEKEEKEPVKKDEPIEDLVDKQKENTEVHIEEGNKEEVVVPEVIKSEDKNDFIHADSAIEEYLALKLIAGEEEISLKAFPELQSNSEIEDIFLKVLNQNPLILSVDAYGYDYASMNLMVRYKEDAATMQKKQKEIIQEATRITDEIIKKGMSDEEKRKAIYDYLNDNTNYQDEVLETAAKTNYELSDSDRKKYADAFTTYGVLVNKVGVCASYAHSFQILADMAGLESVVVTGNVSGVPHAWNKVKINDEWYHLDTTNNETNVQVPYMFYQTPDDVAEENGLIQNKEFWIDNEIETFNGEKIDYDYYYTNGLIVNNEKELLNAIKDSFKEGNELIVSRMDNKLSDEQIYNAMESFLTKEGSDYIDSAVFGSNGNYIVLILK